MSRKDDRIKALEEANATLVATNIALAGEVAELKAILDQHENGRRVQGQSLGGRVRSEWHDLTGRLFGAVGL